MKVLLIQYIRIGSISLTLGGVRGMKSGNIVPIDHQHQMNSINRVTSQSIIDID